MATARNLVLSERRYDQLHRRHLHRLLEMPAGPFPEEAALQQEEQAAAAAALRALDEPDQELLRAHYVSSGGVPVRSTGQGYAVAEPRAPGVTSRLARARARARVAYLLELRRITPPTSRCRSVLEALSTGDRRLQRRAGVSEHLPGCPTCAECAPALVGRRRVLYGVLPAPLLALLRPVRAAHARAPRTTNAVAVAAVASAVVAVLVAGASARHPATARPPVAASVHVVEDGQPVAESAWGSGAVTAVAGAAVRAVSVPVQSVPADEGFWVGVAGHRFWVQLASRGESPQQVKAGDIVSFSGKATRVSARSAAGPDAAQGRRELAAQGGYVSVRPADLTIVRGPGG